MKCGLSVNMSLRWGWYCSARSNRRLIWSAFRASSTKSRVFLSSSSSSSSSPSSMFPACTSVQYTCQSGFSASKSRLPSTTSLVFPIPARPARMSTSSPEFGKSVILFSSLSRPKNGRSYLSCGCSPLSRS